MGCSSFCGLEMLEASEIHGCRTFGKAGQNCCFRDFRCLQLPLLRKCGWYVFTATYISATAHSPPQLHFLLTIRLICWHLTHGTFIARSHIRMEWTREGTSDGNSSRVILNRQNQFNQWPSQHQHRQHLAKQPSWLGSAEVILLKHQLQHADDIDAAAKMINQQIWHALRPYSIFFHSVACAACQSTITARDQNVSA